MNYQLCLCSSLSRIDSCSLSKSGMLWHLQMHWCGMTILVHWPPLMPQLLELASELARWLERKGNLRQKGLAFSRTWRSGGSLTRTRPRSPSLPRGCTPSAERSLPLVVLLNPRLPFCNKQLRAENKLPSLNCQRDRTILKCMYSITLSMMRTVFIKFTWRWRTKKLSYSLK